MPVTLYLAIPCYNEEEVLPETAKRLRGPLARKAVLVSLTMDRKTKRGI